MRNVLVVGGTGFVGRHLVAALRDSGWARPIAVSRGSMRSCREAPHRDDAPGDADGRFQDDEAFRNDGDRAGRRRSGTAPPVEALCCDLTQPAALAGALRDVDLVVNCIGGRPANMVRATGLLLDAARHAGIRRIVHLSSMAVYGDAVGEVDETAPLPVGRGDYAEAKITCEALVGAYVASGREAVILRPGCIYGPGGTAWTARIGRLLQTHRLGDLGAAGDGWANLVHIEDVVGAILAALTRTAAAGAVCNLVGPEVPRWNRYFIDFARAIGAVPVRRIGRRRLAVEARLLAPPLWLLGRGAPGRPPDPIPPSLLRFWGQPIRLDRRHADAVLQPPRVSLAEGLQSAADWFLGSIAGAPRSLARAPGGGSERMMGAGAIPGCSSQ